MDDVKGKYKEVDWVAIESGDYDHEEKWKGKVFKQIDIPFIETLNISTLIEPHERFILFENLHEELIYDSEWESFF